MSRPWKSELSIALGRGATTVQWLSPWSRRVLHEARGEGAPVQALPAALAALRERAESALPKEARLLVPDELVYLSLVQCHGDWKAAHQTAARHFASTLGETELIVQVAEMQAGTSWLAAAVDRGDVSAWKRLLADAGVLLDRVQLQLLDDLRRLSGLVPDEAIVALLREEGSTLLRIERGTPVELRWERCDPRVLRLVEQRLVAFQGNIVSSQPPRVWMLCLSEAQRLHWEHMARAHGWTLLQRGMAAPIQGSAA